MLVAIDAQISPDVAGGTETALLSLIGSLGRSEGEDRYLLLGLEGYSEKLRPYMGPNQEVLVWPGRYSWFVPDTDIVMSPRWQRLHRLAGPFGPLIKRAHRNYAAADSPQSAHVRALIERAGPLRPVASRLHRAYQSVRRGTSRRDDGRSHEQLLRSRGVRAVHFPYPLHFRTSIPFVYEPWGLPHAHFPELFRPGEPEWMDRVFRDGCERAALIVTATRWVKRDIVTRYGIAPGKIAVIPRRPDISGRAPSPVPELGSIYSLPPQFALFPAMIWPTKNHLGMLRAVARLRDLYNMRLNVICTGRTDNAHWRVVNAELERLALGEQVRFLGPVPYDHLQALFARARFLVFPSLFEGQGLPVLEAFYHGLPVLTSNTGSLPEVVGDAALTCDTRDADAFATALRRAMGDSNLLTKLSLRGRERLEHEFPSPRKVARMFLACYRRCVGGAISKEDRILIEEMMA